MSISNKFKRGLGIAALLTAPLLIGTSNPSYASNIQKSNNLELLLNRSLNEQREGYYGHIGIYSDMEAITEHTELTHYANTDIYVIALVNTDEVEEGLTAAEFKVGNYFDQTDPVVISEEWSSSLVVGDLSTDFAIAWTLPQPGPIVNIGTISVFLLDSSWPGSDYVLSVERGDECDCLTLVDEDFNIGEASGGVFTIYASTPAQKTNWSKIKTLY